MKCLETRAREGLRWRRYRTDDGRIVTTLEVPEQVFRATVRKDRLQERLEGWRREQERAALQARGLALLAEGWKPLAVAHELKVDVRTAQRWQRERGGAP